MASVVLSSVHCYTKYANSSLLGSPTYESTLHTHTDSYDTQEYVQRRTIIIIAVVANTENIKRLSSEYAVDVGHP